MSVLVIAKFQGDTAKFTQALADRGGEFAEIGDRARSAGGIQHRFGVGDGFIVVVDEWQSADHFMQFFSDPSLQAFIGSVGAEPGPPEIIIAEAISSPDQY
jgi:hypothetical protein